MRGMENAPSVVLADRAAYLDAVEEVRAAAAAYYGDGTSALDDDTFDRLMRGIAAYEAARPEDAVEQSPTALVAAGAVEGGDVVHSVPMLSLDNVFGQEDLERWGTGLARRLGGEPRGFHVGPKIDGLAVAAYYTGGKLVRLVTRGNGTTGEDVSHAIGTVDGLPEVLAAPVSVEVRGEIVLTNDQFEEANRIRAEYGEPVFSNPRNAAAGSLRATGRAYTIPLSCYAYTLLPAADGDDTADERGFAERTHSALMDTLGALGVRTVADTPVGARTVATLGEALAYIETVAARRDALPLGIDGVVIKADHPDDQRTAGTGSRAPRWAVAYKFPAVEKTTRIVDVTWATGRTGFLAPRAQLEPVEIAGVTVAFATLHSPGMIGKLDLRIGDTVTVRRAGDVIPYVVGPVVAARTGAETPIALPEKCPGCGGEIDSSQERWRCVQGRACDLSRSVEYAVGRDQLDIEGLGPKIVVRLVADGAVADIADLFTLTREQLVAATGSEKNSDKILANILAAKERPLSRVFCALGVRGTGRSMSRRIARHFGTMAAIVDADAAALQEVDGIGPEKAAMLLAELAELAPVIAKLKAAGVDKDEPRVAAVGQSADAVDGEPGEELPLAGMTVVATGSMTGPLAALSRTAVNELIERAGGRAGSSVSKSTTLLVAGANAGSKKAKAESLGVRVVTPEEFGETVAAYLP
ncbi:NAD-dependent DNA ligase LigA [Yinghuangia seranimata]|uniref:NAD-dependent DNA ligase LigA n=1 Tax=Yinghuangia seranimata TaxID=408067 RepID=UPI00248C3673|nr:NAD-dependent DNA ligase LigA [Yinghuangia seranimata]MDI2128431.1 NAD-dependent DNA ligase LigA [Yinghuangia seranimata]